MKTNHDSIMWLCKSCAERKVIAATNGECHVLEIHKPTLIDRIRDFIKKCDSHK
jgi:hypothetical protein